MLFCFQTFNLPLVSHDFDEFSDVVLEPNHCGQLVLQSNVLEVLVCVLDFDVRKLFPHMLVAQVALKVLLDQKSGLVLFCLTNTGCNLQKPPPLVVSLDHFCRFVHLFSLSDEKLPRGEPSPGSLDVRCSLMLSMAAIEVE